MRLTRTRELLPRVEWLDSAPSTNAALRELHASEGASLPHGTLIVTSDQTAGRGRQGRGWVTPPGTAIAASLLVRGFGEARGGAGPAVGGGLPGSWLPLLAGSAVTAALQPLFSAEGADVPAGEGPKRVGVKWPNDVHVRDEADAEAGRSGRKLCGILCELLGDGSIVVGTGFNLLIPEWELPTDRATSLLAAGADIGGAETLESEAGREIADRVLAAYARRLLQLAEQARVDPAAARRRVLRDSLTLGAEVRVHLPGGEIVDGRAAALEDDGALAVDLPTGGRLVVSAADVEHLR